MILREITCKSILSLSKIPKVDYVINPYVGCEHGCVYCYAIFMKRLTDHPEPWGRFVDVKVNALEQLRRDLRRSRPGEILLSSVTDPYQPVEKKYGVTRACLEILQQVKLPVSILTKSALVLRDIDLLKHMKRVDVGFTITTLNDELRKLFEPRSSPIEERFKAVRLLSDAGIKTWIFFGPVLPYFSDREETIDHLFLEAQKNGAGHIYIDRMNLYQNVWRRLEAVLKMKNPKVLPYYRRVRKEKDAYSDFLRKRVRNIARRYAVPWRLLF